MRKVYTNKDYADLAVQATIEHKTLEVFVDILEHPIYNEEGEITGYTKEEVENIRLVEQPNALAMLKMTPLDFLKALIQLGISYDTIKAIMGANPAIEMEMEFCQNVYRGHPMIEQFAQQYGIPSEVLDNIFIQANTIIKEEEPQEVEEPPEEEEEREEE